MRIPTPSKLFLFVTRRAGAIALLACGGVAAGSSAAGAVVFCATTANQIQSFLTTASTNGTDDEIRIAAGSYSPSATLAYSTFVDQDLAISGGWNQACTSQRRDPAQTVIDGSGEHRVLDIYVGTSTATVSVRYLTLQDGDGGAELGGGLSLTGGAGSHLYAAVEHLILRNNKANAGAAAEISTDLGTLRLANCLVVGNVAQASIGLSLTANGPQTTIVHNTIVSNTISGGGTVGGLRIGGNTPAVIANNIFWGNEGTDLWLSNSSLYFLYANDVENQDGTPAGGANNVSVAPEFVAAGNWRLAPDSPLVDVGDTANAILPLRDLVTGQRSLDGGPDLGAYESEHLFSDGFEAGNIGAWFTF